MDPISDTQREAWEAIQPKLPELRARVYEIVKWNSGAALFEVSLELRIPFHHISGCFTQLRDVGMIRDSGERRIFPRTGKKHIVWKATPNDTPQKRIKVRDRWKAEALAARKVIDKLPPIAFFEPGIQNLLKAHDRARNAPYNDGDDASLFSPRPSSVIGSV